MGMPGGRRACPDDEGIETCDRCCHRARCCAAERAPMMRGLKRDRDATLERAFAHADAAERAPMMRGLKRPSTAGRPRRPPARAAERAPMMRGLKPVALVPERDGLGPADGRRRACPDDEGIETTSPSWPPG